MPLTKKCYWKGNEVVILSNNFSNSSREELQNLLPKRTWKSNRRKAERMKLERMKYYLSLRPKNHHFFKKWSEEMAYILGFITADGHIRKNNYSYKLSFSIHEKDKDILEKINGILAPNNKLSYNKKEKMFYLSFASPHIYNDLLKLGITPLKTFKVTPPKIPKKYIRHYLRGYFDGDGCIYIGKRSDMIKQFPGVRIIGNLEMTEYIRKTFGGITNSKLKVHITYSEYKKPMGNLYYTSKNAIKILDFLYKNSNIHLDRKFKKYKYIKEVT